MYGQVEGHRFVFSSYVYLMTKLIQTSTQVPIACSMEKWGRLGKFYSYMNDSRMKRRIEKNGRKGVNVLVSVTMYMHSSRLIG